jgi:uncharacterized surface protein with fasciclin (FAS1) repeats
MTFIIKDKIILYYFWVIINPFIMKNTVNHLLGYTLLFTIFLSCNPSATSPDANLNATQVVTGQSAVKDDVSNPNIVQVAVGSKDHTTLVAALKAADYVDALTNVGPFTVFAPTNAAFDALPDGTVASLVKPENQRKLRDILEYHVLLGVYKTEDFVSDRKIGTADGRSVEISKMQDGTVLINGAKIIASVQTSNGIIHIIDQVLLPA